MFTGVEIQNYRGLKHLKINDFSRINILFGRNNCGKSSLLEALFLIAGQSNPSLPSTTNNLRGLNPFNEKVMETDFYGGDPSNTIKIEASGDNSRHLQINMIQSDSQKVSVEELNSGKSDTPQKFYGIKVTYSLNGNNVEYHSEFTISTDKPQEGKMSIDNRYKEDLFARYIPSNYIQLNLMPTFAKILQDKQERFIIDTLIILEPNLKEIKQVGDDIMADVGFDKLMPINVLGDGVRKILNIALALFEHPNSIILIDELENGLHYSTMSKIWEAIFFAAKKNNTQLFITTHSQDLLKGLISFLESANDKDYKNDLSAFKLFRQKGDEIQSLRYGYDELSYSIQQLMEVR